MRDYVLLEQIKVEFKTIVHDITIKLKKLEAQNILTNLDYQKIKFDFEKSAEAVLKAINNEDYPPKMQHELIKSLIEQFKNDANKIIKDCGLKLTDFSSIEKRLIEIDNRISLEFDNGIQNWIIENSEKINIVHREFYKTQEFARKSLQETEDSFLSYEILIRDFFNKNILRIGAISNEKDIKSSIGLVKTEFNEPKLNIKDRFFKVVIHTIKRMVRYGASDKK